MADSSEAQEQRAGVVPEDHDLDAVLVDFAERSLGFVKCAGRLQEALIRRAASHAPVNPAASSVYVALAGALQTAKDGVGYVLVTLKAQLEREAAATRGKTKPELVE